MTRILTYLLITFCYLLIISSNGYSQQFNFKNYSVENGLAQSKVNVVFEDKRGNLWIGTDGGINKFDGYNFNKLSTADGLANNRINTIYQSANNTYWIGTINGLSCYDGLKFTNYHIDKGLSNNNITAICEDKKGGLWIGSKRGLLKFNKGVFSNISSFKDLDNTTINSLIVDQENNLWIGTETKGLIKFNGKTLVEFNVENRNILSNSVNQVYKDLRNKIWIVTDRCVSYYNPKANRLTRITQNTDKDFNGYSSIVNDLEDNYWIGTSGEGILKYEKGNLRVFNSKNGLSNNFVQSLICDMTGDIWIGTNGGGLSKYYGERFSHYTDKDGLVGKSIISVFEDNKHNYWFGTYGSGVTVFNGTTFKNYNSKSGLPSNIITTIMQDKKGNIWLGTQSGGVSKFDGNHFTNYTIKDGLISNHISAIMQDKGGDIWIGTDQGINVYDGKKIQKYTKDEGLSSNNITCIFQDSKNNIWIGTDGYGINKLSVNNANIQIFPFSEKDGLVSNYIISITEDPKHNIWIGTNGGGLCKYNGEKFISYSNKQHLDIFNIYFLVFDEFDKLWLGSENGIYRLTFDTKFEKIREQSQYTMEDGLISVETNRNSVLRDSKNNLWFGSIKGVTRYSQALDKLNQISPTVYISNIKLFNEKTDWSKFTKHIDKYTNLPVKLSLPYNRNHLTFEFVGLNLKAPEQVKYKWKLEGFDEDWSPVTDKREAIYSYIPPGEYKFMLMASNGDGVWSSKPVIFEFKIKPPFWASFIFYIILGLSCGLVIYIYIRIRLYNLSNEKRSLESKVKWKTRQLQLEKENLEINKEELHLQASKLETANRELEKLSAVVRETSNSVVITKANGDIEWTNEGFKRLYEYDYEEFSKKFGNNLIQSSVNKDINIIIKKCIQTKKSATYETLFPCNNGKNKWIQTTITPVFEEEELISFILIESNITQIKLAEEKILKQKEEIEFEKSRTDRLLSNILPTETAEELKLKGKATARHYRLVTVMFTDFKSFTQQAETMSPNQLVSELHKHFVKFDQIIEKYYIEKIKTIGDAYMCAGGLPIRNKSNPVDVILAAMEINRYMIEYYNACDPDKPALKELRIGIHTGSVIAGVVGKKKFAFDIWGDSVNTASRMESSGESGKINISGETYELVKEFFDCTYRGKVYAKHKGEIDMYFVNSITEEYSEDGLGIIPNNNFLARLSDL